MTTKREAGAHALLVSANGTVLLAQKGVAYRYDERNAGRVSMFGGRVEAGEEPRAALTRELMEELALDVSACDVEALRTYQKTKELDGTDVDVHVFIVRVVHPSTLRIREENHAATTDLDVNAMIIEGPPDELLARVDLTRITRLALGEYTARLGGRARRLTHHD